MASWEYKSNGQRWSMLTVLLQKYIRMSCYDVFCKSLTQSFDSSTYLLKRFVLKGTMSHGIANSGRTKGIFDEY